jgi:hypothetical protein
MQSDDAYAISASKLLQFPHHKRKELCCFDQTQDTFGIYSEPRSGRSSEARLLKIIVTTLNGRISGKDDPMAKRRGNPNWGKLYVPMNPEITAFELAVEKFELVPADYERSARLRLWAQRNFRDRYVPEDLLKAWHLDRPTVDFSDAA